MTSRLFHSSQWTPTKKTSIFDEKELDLNPFLLNSKVSNPSTVESECTWNFNYSADEETI